MVGRRAVQGGSERGNPNTSFGARLRGVCVCVILSSCEALWVFFFVSPLLTHRTTHELSHFASSKHDEVIGFGNAYHEADEK